MCSTPARGSQPSSSSLVQTDERLPWSRLPAAHLLGGTSPLALNLSVWSAAGQDGVPSAIIRPHHTQAEGAARFSRPTPLTWDRRSSGRPCYWSLTPPVLLTSDHQQKQGSQRSEREVGAAEAFHRRPPDAVTAPRGFLLAAEASPVPVTDGLTLPSGAPVGAQARQVLAGAFRPNSTQEVEGGAQAPGWPALHGPLFCLIVVPGALVPAQKPSAEWLAGDLESSGCHCPCRGFPGGPKVV